MEVEDELREEIGMEKHIRMKVVGSRQRWAGHIRKTSEERIKDEGTVLREVSKGQR